MLTTGLSNQVATRRHPRGPRASTLAGVRLVLLLCLGSLLLTNPAQGGVDPGLPDSVLIGFNHDSTIQCNNPDGYNQSVALWMKVDTSVAAVEFRIEVVSVDSGQAVADDYYHWGTESNWLPNAEVVISSDGQLPDTITVRRWALNADEYYGPFDDSGQYYYPWSCTKIHFSCHALGRIEVRNLDGQTKFWPGGAEPFGDDYYYPAFPSYTIALVDTESPIIADPGYPDSVVIEAGDITIGESTPVAIRIHNDEPLDRFRMRFAVKVDAIPGQVRFDSLTFPLSTDYLSDRYFGLEEYSKGDFLDTLWIRADHYQTLSGPLPTSYDQPVALAWFTGIAAGEVRIENLSSVDPKFYSNGNYTNYFIPQTVPADISIVDPDPGGGAADTGVPDTLRIESGSVRLGQSSPIAVSLYNDEPISGLTIPLEISSVDQGNVRFDSLRWVGRLADPDVAQLRFWSKVAPGRILVLARDVDGEPIVAGSGPIAELFFSGVAEGEVSADTYSTAGYSCTLMSPGGTPFGPEIAPAVIEVVPLLPPPPVFEPLATESLTGIVGAQIAFEIAAYSSVNNPVAVALAALRSPDSPERLPIAVPNFTDGQPGLFSWSPASGDVGVWEAVFEAVDEITNLSTDLAVRVQVVSNSEYLVSFEVKSSSSAAHASALTHGDFNHDNRPEVLMSSIPWGTGKVLGVYDLASTGALEEVFAMSEDYPNMGIVTGYFNGDAHLDAVSCLSNHLWVFTGNGNNTFSVHDNSELNDGNVQAACLTNHNNDASLDYAVATTLSVTIYTLDSTAVFRQATQFEAGNVPMSINSADFDGDGWDDLAVGTSQGLEIYLNNQQGGYTLADSYEQPFISTDISVTGQGSDFNGDGDHDLLLASPSLDGQTSELMVYFGLGDGSFTQELVRTLRGRVHVTRSGDINNDGLLDIVFLNSEEHYVGVIFGDGAGQFEDEIRIAVPDAKPNKLDCVDIDSDGDLDLVVAAYQPVTSDVYPKLYLFANQSNPGDKFARPVQIQTLDNAGLEIIAPDDSRLSATTNGLVSGEMYRRNLDGDAYMDASASIFSVEAGRYDLVVTPRPGAAQQTFSLEYGLNGVRYQIARDLPIGESGYVFPIYPDGASGVSPRQGQSVCTEHPVLVWDSTGVVPYDCQSSLPFSDAPCDIRVSSDPNFLNVIESATVEGGSYTMQTSVAAQDTISYFWQVRVSGESEWGGIYVFQNLPWTPSNNRQMSVGDKTDIDASRGGSGSGEADEEAADSSDTRQFALLQNQPNPFNPTTNISYSLSHGGWVRLEVFNVLGRLVTTLVDEYQGTGDYVATWDASRSASGIYLYRLSTDEFKATRKMILVK